MFSEKINELLKLNKCLEALNLDEDKDIKIQYSPKDILNVSEILLKENISFKSTPSITLAPWIFENWAKGEKKAIDFLLLWLKENLEQRTLVCLIESCAAKKIELIKYDPHMVIRIIKHISEIKSTENTAFLIHIACLYLAFFTNIAETEEDELTIITNIILCRHFYFDLEARKTANIRESELNLFKQKYLSCFNWDNSKIFEDLKVLSENEIIQSILKLVNKVLPFGYYDHETLMKMTKLTENDYLRLKNITENILADEAAQDFLRKWLFYNCHQYDLKWIEQNFEHLKSKEKEELFEENNYIVRLYQETTTINLEYIDSDQCILIADAIDNKKHHFVNMMQEHEELLKNIPCSSILIQSNSCVPRFDSLCNLNTLSIKDVKSACGIERNEMLMTTLKPKTYTFNEIKTLSKAPKKLVELYNFLKISSIDQRILVIRQMLKLDDLFKENVFNREFEINEKSKNDYKDILKIIAKNLSKKPLSLWREDEFGHIKDIQKMTIIKTLVRYEDICPLIPNIKNESILTFIVRNIDHYKSYTSIESILNDAVATDKDLSELKEKGLIDFKSEEINKDALQYFVINGGANMVNCLIKITDKSQHQKYKKIVKAILMDKFYLLKYNNMDLEKEITLSLSKQQKELWMQNSILTKKDYSFSEKDDFYTTIALGQLPKHSCLSYIDGTYAECLLSCFDSNKKIIIIEKNGIIIGRAIIRLTKGCSKITRRSIGNKKILDFVDVGKSTKDEAGKSEKQEEHLVLFVERLYSYKISEQDINFVYDHLFKLVIDKAKELNAKIVIGAFYEQYALRHGEIFQKAKYNIYISKSKGGKQYLDSLNGCNTESSYDQYHSGNFYINDLPLSSEKAV